MSRRSMFSCVPSSVRIPFLLLCVSASILVGLRVVEALTTVPTTITIGVITAFTQQSDDAKIPSPPYDSSHPLNTSSYFGFGSGPGEYAALKFQFEQINQRTDILPRTQIQLINYDDQYVNERGFFGALNLLNAGAKALIGCSSSGPSGNAQFVAQQFNAPLLSWAASSPTLANKRTYPMFARLCQNDAAQAVAMASIARDTFGWDEIALLYTSDSYGSAGADKFLTAALNWNITVLAQQNFATGASLSELDGPMSRLKASGARIFIYFGQGGQDFVNVLKNAQSRDLLSNQTVWFTSDAVPSLYYDPEILPLLSGVISVAPDGGSSTPGYQTFKDQFDARPLDPVVQERWTDSIDNFQFYQAFAADAATTMALSLHSLIETQSIYDFTGSQLLAEIVKQQFVGVSGHVQFDENYDRVGINFELLNYQPGAAWTSVGAWNDGVYTKSSSVLWRDGTTNVPIAHDPIPGPPGPVSSVLSSNSKSVFIALPCLLLAAILLTALTLYSFRTSRVIHAASPSMLILVLFGGMLVSISVLLSAFPQEAGICTSRVWMFNMGFNFAFGALFLKTYRVHTNFNNRKLVVSHFNDAKLFKMLLTYISFDLIVLILRTSISPYTLDEKQVCTFASGMKNDAATALTGILIASKALVIVSAAYLSYAVRNLPQLYNESSYLAIAIYNTLLLCCAWIGVRYGVDLSNKPDVATMFDSGIMLAAAFLNLLIVFAPKLYDIYVAEKAASFQNNIRKKNMNNRSSIGLNSIRKEKDLGSGGNKIVQVGTTSGGTIAHSVSDILKMLQKLHTTTTDHINLCLIEMRRFEDTIATKKSDIESSTDLLFQIEMEIDYYEQMSRNSQVTEESLIQLFEQRLQEFGANRVDGGGGNHSLMVSNAMVSHKDSSSNPLQNSSMTTDAGKRQSIIYGSLASTIQNEASAKTRNGPNNNTLAVNTNKALTVNSRRATGSVVSQVRSTTRVSPAPPNATANTPIHNNNANNPNTPNNNNNNNNINNNNAATLPGYRSGSPVSEMEISRSQGDRLAQELLAAENVEHDQATLDPVAITGTTPRGVIKLHPTPHHARQRSDSISRPNNINAGASSHRNTGPVIISISGAIPIAPSPTTQSSQAATHVNNPYTWTTPDAQNRRLSN